MRFIVVHKVCTYLMVIIALVAVLIGAQLHPLVVGLVLAAAGISWFWEPPRVQLVRLETLWNVATLVVLGSTIVSVVRGNNVLLAATDFVIFLTVNKLFNRRASRDYLQLYVLSFLQMTAATVLNTSLSYGALFLLYVVATTWTMILFHLKREMEENYLLKYGGSLEGRPVRVQRVMNSRKLVGPKFLVVTSALSMLVFAGAATLFFLFPRVGFGYFFKKSRPGITMTGFSDQVELGQFGVIKNDPTVVLRAEFPNPADRHRLAPYWRGITFDHYDGRRWTKSLSGTGVGVRPRRGRYEIRPSVASADPQVEQVIYLEPMETPVLFGLNRFEAVALTPNNPGLPGHFRSVRQDAEGDVHYTQMDDVGFRYRAFSRRERVESRALGAPLSAYRREARRAAGRYLQLPARLDPRVAALANRIIGDASTVGEAVSRVERWLETNLTYTVELERDHRYSPLADFLFVQRRGHCEYFGTAMVVLLRSQGIAARSVNGFLGGTWNPYGNYLAVSQGDAHSWTEVWLADGQWMTRDATPSGPARGAGQGWFSGVRQLTDALRMRWFKHVIEYDLQSQVGAIAKLRAAWRSMFGGRGRRGQATATRVGRWVLGGVAGLGLILALLALRRRRPGDAVARRSRASASAAELFVLLVRAYTRRGFPQRPGTTAREYLAALERRGAPDLALAGDVVDVYERTRFGGAVGDGDRLRALRARIKQVGARRANRPR